MYFSIFGWYGSLLVNNFRAHLCGGNNTFSKYWCTSAAVCLLFLFFVLWVTFGEQLSCTPLRRFAYFCFLQFICFCVSLAKNFRASLCGGWRVDNINWEHLGVSGSIWEHLEASGSIWEHLGASGSIWGHLGASGSIWEHLWASGGIWEHLGASGSICQQLGASQDSEQFRLNMFRLDMYSCCVFDTPRSEAS